MTDPIFTTEQLAEIHAYHRPLYVWLALREVVALAVGLLWLRFGVQALYQRSSKIVVPSQLLRKVWQGDEWASALVFALGYFAINTILFLPFSVYFGYFHEHAFGLSHYTPMRFAIDFIKSTLVSIGAFAALTFGMFGLARRFRRWWLALGLVGGLLLFASAALDPYRARIFFHQQPLPEGELREKIRQLMAKASVDFQEIVVEDNSHATVRLQAYFAGQHASRTIVLSRSLVDVLSTPEVLAVVAHEAAHVHESRLIPSAASALALLALLFGIEQLMRWVQRRGFWGVSTMADIRILPLLFLLFTLGTMLAAPVAGAFSRERERNADAYALQLTHDAESFISMLVKAARANKMDPDPPEWVTLKGRTHPAVRERINAAEAFARRHPSKD